MQRGEITLRDLVALVRAKAERDENYAIYATDRDYDAFSPDTRVYVASPVEFDVNDAEVLPPAIAARGLAIFCHCDLLQDVVDNAVMQKRDVRNEEIIDGLDHYLVHDAFMDYVTQEPTGQGGRAIWGGGKHGRVGRLDSDGKPKPPRS